MAYKKSSKEGVSNEIGLKPIYDKGGVQCYQLEDGTFLLTNDDGSFCYAGTQAQLCEIYPPLCQ